MARSRGSATLPKHSHVGAGGQGSAPYGAPGKEEERLFRRSAWLEFLRNHRTELLIFGLSALVLAGFSGNRFLRQSAAPHFVYQAKAWLSGRLDIDPQVLPNLEDWACVRVEGGVKRRCEGNVRSADKWYVSFPPFPALAMTPFVAVNGYQFNDTSFGVFVGALALALFYGLLRKLSELGESKRTDSENVALTLLMGFGTVFFYCAIRGEVWFSAEVMGVACSCLYLRFAVAARRPVLAGVFFSMATLTRTPLLFTGLFFVMEILRSQNVRADPKPALRSLGLFAAGASPLAVAAAAYNQYRFGSLSQFGHAFLYNNRVNADIDQYGLFNLAYLTRNLKAAFFFLPEVHLNPLSLGYSFHGLSLLLTLPLIIFLFIPVSANGLGRKTWALAGSGVLLGYALLAQRFTDLPLAPFFVLPPVRGDFFPAGVSWATSGMLLAVALPVSIGFWSQKDNREGLRLSLWLAVAATALPGFLYQNDGFAQFGFRFSLDYTPYLFLLFAIGSWSLKNRWVMAACALGVLVGFWGAVGFRGYTELMRGG